jgi:hypothetical protein
LRDQHRRAEARDLLAPIYSWFSGAASFDRDGDLLRNNRRIKQVMLGVPQD